MSTAPLPFMMPDMEKATGIVRITSGGIQNLAALIPLLTTVLCEKHVTKALKGGLLYAAVAPMTVFGSLGIAKAGVIALCATIDYRFFHGPALLKNAGFPPRGIGKLFLHVKHNKHHLYKAEDKLRIILSKKKVTEVKVNLWSRDFWWWNICLALSTALMCIIGFLPYIFLIRIFLAERSFHTTWIFPILRLFGSGLVVVNTQFLFQLRLIEETYYRLRFIAADTYLKDTGKTIPTSWDPNERSKKVFSELQLEWLPITDETEETSGYDLKNADKEKILNGVHKLTSFKFDTTVPAPTDDRDTLHRPHSSPVPPIATLDLGPPQSSGEHTTSATTPDTSFLDTLSLPQGDTLTSPTTPGSPSPQGSLHRRSGSEIRKDTAAFNEAEQGAPQSENTPSPRRSDTNSSTGSKFSSAKANKAIIWLTLQFPTLILWGTQAILFFGVVCIIVGYIGCFTVVQLSPGWKGPLLWFLCEVLLSAVRTVIWAANPEWDDARRPIVLEKVQKKDGTTTKSSSYGIAWTLDSPTADDMHALLIGVNNCNTTDFENLEKAKSDAQSVANYLEETLLVPPSQIRTLYDTDATRIKIVEELKSLRHRGSVTPDAPIIIYYAGHSFVSDNGSTYLVPHLPNGDRLLAGEPEKYCLPYSEIVDLLQHVADEKTDNIVVIIDSCHAGAMGHNSHFDSQPNSSSRPAFTPSHPSQPIPSRLPPAPKQKSIGDTLGMSLLPSISRTSDTEGVPDLSLSNLPRSPERQDEALAVGDLDHRLHQVEDNEVRDRGKEKKKRQKKITNATTEILVGHSSHLLLAGADSSQQAYEDPAKGGKFTQFLLEALEEAGESGDLQTMTYQRLVGKIQDKFRAIVDPTGTSEHQTLLDYQTALCTTMYQNRYLFDGLFTRKVDNTSPSPVMRVRYSD